MSNNGCFKGVEETKDFTVQASNVEVPVNYTDGNGDVLSNGWEI